MAETSDFRAQPPEGIDAIGASSEGASLYQLIRDDIIEGRLAANERLVVTDLARRHGTSTNPVREALQLLRGEGFVTLVPNRGARVRPIDQDFVRDIYEIGVLIEPALTRWFVNMATVEDIAELERIQDLIEENDFADTFRHSELDTAFHTVMLTGDYVPWVNPQAYRELTTSTSTPIHTGEQIYLRHNFKELIETQAVRVIGPDPADIGGIAELKWVAEHAYMSATPSWLESEYSCTSPSTPVPLCLARKASIRLRPVLRMS